MRIGFKSLAVALAAALFVPAVIVAQMPSSKSGESKSAEAYDPHDLSGMWDFFNKTPGQGIYATPSKDHPPFTPWAQARYDQAKPGYGPKAQPGETIPFCSATLPEFRESFSSRSLMKSCRHPIERSCSSNASMHSVKSGRMGGRMRRIPNRPGWAIPSDTGTAIRSSWIPWDSMTRAGWIFMAIRTAMNCT